MKFTARAILRVANELCPGALEISLEPTNTRVGDCGIIQNKQRNIEKAWFTRLILARAGTGCGRLAIENSILNDSADV